jgi:photosystem II stability/assembly factor-like uncharacterized protein
VKKGKAVSYHWMVLGLAVFILLACSTFSGMETPLPSDTANTHMENATSTKTLAAATAPTLPLTPTPTLTTTPLHWSWTQKNSGQIMPRDVVTAIVFDPDSENVMYVGTENSGIYKSLDGGKSWQAINQGLAGLSIDSLVINPKNSQILYAGVISSGVYKTSDGGTTWIPIHNGMGDIWYSPPSQVTISQQIPEILYYIDGENTYRSMNGGESWDLVEIDCPFSIGSLVISPKDSDVLFATSTSVKEKCQTGVYKSTDGGTTWSLVLPTDGIGGKSLYISGNGKYVYARANGNQFFGSTDEGTSWEKLPLRISNMNIYESCAISPQNSELIMCAGGYEQVFTSRNAGKSWIPSFPRSISAIAFKPGTQEIIMVGDKGSYADEGGRRNGLWESVNGGISWTDRSLGMGNVRFELQKNLSNEIMYLHEMRRDWWGSFNEKSYLYYSLDDGVNITAVNKLGAALALDADGKTLYRLGMSPTEAIIRSPDKGNNWYATKNPDRSNTYGSPVGIEAHPYVSGLIFAFFTRFNVASGVTVFTSWDMGRTWDAVLPSNLDVYLGGSISTAFHEGTDGYLLFHHSSLFRTKDTGRSWYECTKPSWNGNVVAVDPREALHVFLGTYNQGIFTSQDGCKSWIASNAGLDSLLIHDIAIDPNNPDLVYAGTDSGVYVSFTAGEIWQRIHSDLPGMTVVYSVLVDAKSNVFIATPSGVYQLDQL